MKISSSKAGLVVWEITLVAVWVVMAILTVMAH